MGKRIPFILGLFLLAFAIWLQITSIGVIDHFITRLENLAYDVQLRAYLLTNKEDWHSTAVVIDVDDASLSREGRWPWPRIKMAKLVERLQAAGVVVAAFDIIFPQKQNNIAEEVYQEFKKEHLVVPAMDSLFQKISPTFDHDAQFAESLSRMDVVLGISFLPTAQMDGDLPAPSFTLSTPEEKQLHFISAAGYLANIHSLQAAAKGGGFVNVFPDEDGIIRRVPILIRYQDSLYPSLALEAVRLYLLSKMSLVTASYSGQPQLEAVQVGDHVIPTDAEAKVIITFRGSSFTFPYYSAIDVLDNKIPPGALQGKIAFIGTSATGQGDLKTTAIQSVFPGVEIQATIADGILTNNFSYKPAWALGAEIFITVFLGLICIFLFPYLGPRVLSLLIVIVPTILIFSNARLWEETGLIITIFIPMMLCVLLALMNMAYGYIFETRKREKLKEMFGQYVPTTHIDEMLESTGELGLLGESRELTVLFADIRNFTTLSEPLTASQLKEMLNEFFTPMTEIIFKFHGTIDKYIGDMIMAFWGAPLKDGHHARHALRAVLEMQNMAEKLKNVFIKKGWPEINIGIGLNTGLMNVGDMGSTFHRNYTVLGDAVNLGSRVESLTKYYGVKNIVTGSTQTGQTIFVFRKLDRVKVKGKNQWVDIYELLGYVKKFPAILEKETNTWHRVLDYYFERQWDKALALLSELVLDKPEEKLYQLYMKRIAEFQTTPPPDDWDGVYTHVEK